LVVSNHVNPKLIASVAVFLVCISMVLHWTTLRELGVLWWRSYTYGHGLLVAPVCLYLLWEKYPELQETPHSVSLSGLFFLTVFNGIWWIAYSIDINILVKVVVLVMPALIVWTVLGKHVFKLLLFPLTYILVAVPVWDPLESILQVLTAYTVAGGLSLVGVPVFLESTYISIPEGQFHIEEVCAGLRYFLAALAIALLFSHMYLKKLSVQMVFVGTALAIAVVVNWVRVFLVILAGHLSNMQHSFVHEHVGLGWWIFSISLIPVFALGIYMHRKSANQAGLPVGVHSTPKSIPGYKPVIVLLSSVLVLILTPVSANQLKQRGIERDFPVVLPEGIGGWEGPFELESIVNISYASADYSLIRSYKKNNDKLALFVAGYNSQSQGKELVHYENRVVGSSNWNIYKNGKILLSNSGETKLAVKESLLKRKQGQVAVMWQWYTVAGENTSSEMMAKLLQLKSIVTGNSRAKVTILVSGIYADASSARSQLEDFVSTMRKKLDSV